eukprot:10516727-Lingulodinium_polyedra.AAC.1
MATLPTPALRQRTAGWAGRQATRAQTQLQPALIVAPWHGVPRLVVFDARPRISWRVVGQCMSSATP